MTSTHEDALVRGRRVTQALKDHLGESSFAEFRDLSLRFRRAELEAVHYIRATRALLGEDGMPLLTELVDTMPDTAQKTALCAALDARSTVVTTTAATGARKDHHDDPDGTAERRSHEDGTAGRSCAICYATDKGETAMHDDDGDDDEEDRATSLLHTRCGHPLCADCLQRWQVANVAAASMCPVCRDPLVILEATVSSATQHRRQRRQRRVLFDSAAVDVAVYPVDASRLAAATGRNRRPDRSFASALAASSTTSTSNTTALM